VHTLFSDLHTIFKMRTSLLALFLLAAGSKSASEEQDFDDTDDDVSLFLTRNYGPSIMRDADLTDLELISEVRIKEEEGEEEEDKEKEEEEEEEDKGQKGSDSPICHAFCPRPTAKLSTEGLEATF
jgi:hypothetical protein